MKTSNPASYDKIFATTSGTVIPSHRALLINCTSTGSISITNLDKSTTSLTMETGLILIPLQINKWTTVTGTFTITALL